MKKLFFLAFSIVLSLILAYLAYFAKIESLTFATNVTILVLAILNVLANIFQIVSFVKPYFVLKSTESVDYRVGTEILTPRYNDVEKIRIHLEDYSLNQIDLELWRKKKAEYLFLRMRKKLKESIKNFYGNVEKYNTLLQRFKALVRMKISSGIYSHCEGVVVPPVDWETGNGFSSKFSNFCKEEAQKICVAVATIALKRKSTSFLQPSDLGVLESPLFHLLRKDASFAFVVRSDDPEVIDENASKYSKKFAKSVFESIFREDSLQEVKDTRERLIEEAGELINQLDSEIRRTS